MRNALARLWSLSNDNRRAAVLPASDYDVIVADIALDSIH